MVRSFSRRNGLYASVSCSDWDDFRVQLRRLLPSQTGSSTLGNRFAFRGQSCSSWGLVSSFDRINRSLSPIQRDEKYDYLLKLFVENWDTYGGISNEAGPKPPALSTEPIENTEAFAQHYGLNTRLLDWSLSPYVAAFFAVSRTDQCKSGMLSIWALDTEFRKHISKHELAFEQNSFRGNARNLWQMGAFTRNRTPHSDMVDLFKNGSRSWAPTLSAGPPLLVRFDIPVTEEPIINDDLQLMRINSMTIFPGLEGVLGWIKKKVGD